MGQEASGMKPAKKGQKKRRRLTEEEFREMLYQVSIVKDRVRSALGEIKTKHAGELSKRIWKIMDNNPDQFKWPDIKEGTNPESRMSKARFSFQVAVAIIDDEQTAGRLSPGPLRRKREESAVQTDDAAKDNTDVSVAEVVSAMDEVSVEDDFVTDDETSLAISSVSPSED